MEAIPETCHSCGISFMTPKFPLLCCWEIILVTLKSPSLWTVSTWFFSFSFLPANHTCYNNKFYPCEIVFMAPKFPLLCCWEITLVTLKSTSLWTVLIWLFSLSLLPGNHTCHNNKFYPCQISLWLRSSPFYAAEKLYLSHWNLHPCEQS